MFKFRTADKAWPCEAGTWNHRAEAVYRAAAENSEHENVKPVLARGLKAVKFVHWRIPPKVWQRFIHTHNSFHQGSGANFIDHLEESVAIESEWELETSKSGLHSANPRYKTAYKDFLLAKSAFGNNHHSRIVRRR